MVSDTATRNIDAAGQVSVHPPAPARCGTGRLEAWTRDVAVGARTRSVVLGARTRSVVLGARTRNVVFGAPTRNIVQRAAGLG